MLVIKEHIKPALLGAISALFIGVSFILITRFFHRPFSRGENKKTWDITQNSIETQNAGEESFFSAESTPKANRITFEDLIGQIQAKNGIYSLYIKDLTSGKIYEYNPEELIYGASLYKILVGATVYDLISQDKLSLNYEYTYEKRDFYGGTGVIQTQPVGTQYSIEELLDYLFKDSDNIAQNILVRNIGDDAILKFYSEISDASATTNQFFVSGKTTAKEVAHILLNIYKTNKWSRQNKKSFFNHMIGTSFDDRISAGLDSSLLFAHKIGNWPDSSYHDCGIVFDNTYSNPVVVCLMTKQIDFNDFMEISRQTGYFINSLLLPL